MNRSKDFGLDLIGLSLIVFLLSPFSSFSQLNSSDYPTKSIDTIEFNGYLAKNEALLEFAITSKRLPTFFDDLKGKGNTLFDNDRQYFFIHLRAVDSILEKAQNYLEEPLEFERYAKICSSTGYFYNRFYRSARALHWYKHANKAKLQSYGLDSPQGLAQTILKNGESNDINELWAYFFRPLSRLYRDKREYEKAIEYTFSKRLINLYASKIPDSEINDMRNLRALMLQENGEYLASISLFKEILSSPKSSIEQQIHALLNITSGFRHTHDFDSIGGYLTRVEELLATVDDQELFEELEVEMEYGYAYFYHDWGNNIANINDSSSIEYLNKALEYYKRIENKAQKGNNKTDYHLSLALGQVNTMLGNFDEAKYYLMPALSLIYGGGSINVARLANAPVGDVRLIYVLDQLSKIEEVKGGKLDQYKLLQSALSMKKAIWAIEDSVRGFYYEDQHRVRFNSSREERREEMLNLLYVMWEKYKDVDLVETALNVCERSRAHELRASLRKQDMISSSNIPQELLDELNELEQKFYEERTEKTSNKGQGTLEEYKARYRLLNDSLKALNPSYHQAVYGTKALNLRELRRAFSLDEVMLAYYWGENHVYRIVLSKKKTSFSRIRKDRRFNREVRQLLEFVKNPYPNAAQEEAYLVAGTNLHRKLIPEDLYRDYDELIIAPHDSLGLIPFGILLENRPDQLEAYDALDYLYSYYSSVRYTLSPGMAKKAKKDANSLKPFRYVGIAPAYVDLEFNVKEVNIVDSIFKEIGYQTKALFDREASKEGFREYAEQGDILHLAMHAQEDIQTGEKSYLLFGDLDTLNLYELYGMSLQAKLAILSACNASKGELQKGEGMISLARAFRFSGCENVVTSLWEVADYEASTMIPDFLLGIEGGYRPADALARAQSIFTSYPENSALPPYYWAQFVVYGENTAMGQPDLTWTKRILWGILLSVLVIALLYFGGQFQSLKRAN